VLRPALVVITLVSLLGLAAAQEQEKKPDSQKQPPIKVNVLNVCTPGTDEQAVLKSALTKAKGKPAFAGDFEIARGMATLKDAPPSKYVRLRRDMASQSQWLTAQYSISRDDKNTVETLVLRMRDPKDFHELSIEDRVSSEAASPGAVLSSDTPAARIRVERLGKSSVALTHCEEVDQSAYAPLFSEASEIMAQYRKTLGLRTEFRDDVEWLAGARKPAASSGVQKKTVGQKKK
jgi:hypothetical protein